MFTKILRSTTRLILILIIATLLVFGLPTLIADWFARSRTFSVADAPAAPVAIVLGAGLTRDGRPSPVLRDRIAAAAQLYYSGKVEILLMTGDNRFLDYNEPGAMRDYAIELGIPEGAIVMDFAGRRTYDSCYRARHIFNVKNALVVTQHFHLPRSVFTCNALGIQAQGVIADQRSYNRYSLRFWRMREVAATARAFVDVYLTRPLPVLGNPEPIFPAMLGQQSDNPINLELD